MSELSDAVRARLKAWTYELGGPGTRARLDKITAPANEFGVDPYGFDLDFAVAAVAPLTWLYRKYFRVELHGVDNVPAEGRVLLVSNHSGQLPFDAAMIEVALLVEKDPPRVVRALVERWVPTLPFVSTFMARCGQIVGTPENCRRLLAADEAILVFPEGVRGLNKPFRERYQLRRFGPGFMRLALESGAPIVPVGVVGAEEQAPALLDLKPLARLLSFPAFPITPTLLPFPLPARYHLHFGEPLRFTGSPDEDDAELERKVAEVQAAVAALLERGLAERKHVFW
ncbi:MULTISPECIES: lysophospholipid acyltransferase family protein [Anaeromyxobacter]|uniref:lysophospholipid acyltransferase family protein n=1 Tax=Anaeromyxobacter TaxID=161492 RepID=UPI001F58A8C0|nr:MULTISPECIES: lysophospholipid acyltransferase family protein [unclassified Anaeromyxobacter]